MVKVVVDRAHWLRGEEDSVLLRPEEDKMCCLGFACLALGLERCDIDSLSSPVRVVEQHPRLKGKLRVFLRDAQGGWNDEDVLNNRTTENLMRVNDDDTTDDDVYREERLKVLGLQIGLEFEFVG